MSLRMCECVYQLQTAEWSLFLAGQCVRQLRSAVTAHLRCIGHHWPAGRQRGEKGREQKEGGSGVGAMT